MPADEKHWDFFIAHSGADRTQAETLYDLLQPHSRVFLDSRCLLLGDDWDTEIAAAQRASRVTVVVVSVNCNRAYYQREEIAAAIAWARDNETVHRVVPLFLSSETRDGANVPYGLRLKHGLTVSRAVPMSRIASLLLDLLQRLPGAAPTTPRCLHVPEILRYEQATRTSLEAIRDRLADTAGTRLDVTEVRTILLPLCNNDPQIAAAMTSYLIDRHLLLKRPGDRVEFSQSALHFLAGARKP